MRGMTSSSRALAFEQGQAAQVFAVQHQQIERAVERGAPAEEERVEVAPAIGIETGDFAVEDGRSTSKQARDFRLQRFPLRERVPVAAHELAFTVLDEREAAEAVEFQFKDEIRIVERLADAKQPHRPIADHVPILPREANYSRDHFRGMLRVEMTTPDDATLLELLAACDALAEATERTNTIVHALAEALILSKRPSDVMVNGYVEQAENSAALLERFRARVAQIKASIRVH